ncbi:MAG TPA: ATP-dependent Clp protease proteolytic subunit [Polyangiaceae bacterium]|jgi:ATP-dependent Clp protease protease subunit|nr:ATP-dependent Clp protease proteolytic subunit [Polyangiaceae bacterium]
MPEDEPQTPAPTPGSRLAAQHLFAARTVLIFGEVTSELAESVSSQLLALATLSREPIRVIVNSPGGHVESGDTIHDVIRFIEPEVKILGTGWVASAGALIFAAADRKNRFALPNTRFLLHQPLGGMSGRATEIEIEAAQILAMRERLNRIFATATGQTYEKIASDTERNHWMTAEAAKAYGLVGRIVERQDQFGKDG